MKRMFPTVEHNLFQGVIDDPKMRAVFERAPQVGRILRPWCRTFRLDMPEWLRLPKRVRDRRAYAPPTPAPTPALPRPAGEGEVREGRRRRRTPREMAAAALAWSARTGKAIDPRKIGAVAYGYCLHWPRDGNCPPPEIGYGGRWRRPPKDYKPPKDRE